MTALSICIPTYNRKEYLRYLLETIEQENVDGIEIVISDNSSCDGTQALVEEYKMHLCISYYRFTKEVPCGENLLNAVIQATSPYCWLMSDDDAFEKGAINHVLQTLFDNPGLSGVSVNVQGYTKNMQEKKEIKYSQFLKKTTHFTDGEQGFSHLGAWMGFWSAHIIHKQRWLQATASQEYLLYKGYHHLYLMACMLKKDPSWIFLANRLIKYRSDNESFYQEYGRCQRFLIDLKAYGKIPSLFFNKSTCKIVQKIVLKQLLFWQLVRAKCDKLSCCSIMLMLKESSKLYFSCVFYWIALVPLFLMPRPILLFIRFGYRRWKKFR